MNICLSRRQIHRRNVQESLNKVAHDHTKSLHIVYRLPAVYNKEHVRARIHNEEIIKKPGKSPTKSPPRTSSSLSSLLPIPSFYSELARIHYATFHSLDEDEAVQHYKKFPVPHHTIQGCWALQTENDN